MVKKTSFLAAQSETSLMSVPVSFSGLSKSSKSRRDKDPDDESPPPTLRPGTSTTPSTFSRTYV